MQLVLDFRPRTQILSNLFFSLFFTRLVCLFKNINGFYSIPFFFMFEMRPLSIGIQSLFVGTTFLFIIFFSLGTSSIGFVYVISLFIIACFVSEWALFLIMIISLNFNRIMGYKDSKEQSKKIFSHQCVHGIMIFFVQMLFTSFENEKYSPVKSTGHHWRYSNPSGK